MESGLEYRNIFRNNLSINVFCLALTFFISVPGGVFGLCDDYISKAEKGDPVAEYKLAECYKANDSVKSAVSFKWFKKAAGQGLPEAEFEVGECYYNGAGVKKNRKYAFKWYGFAAVKDYSPAYLKLAQCYDKAQGTAKNIKEAVKWYVKAADEANDAQAQYYLGVYYNDKGDFARSIKYLTASADNGNKKAAELLNGLGTVEPAPVETPPVLSTAAVSTAPAVAESSSSVKSSFE